MSEWIEASLGDVCHVYQPKTLAQKQLKPGSIPVYGANGQIGWHDESNHETPQLLIGCRGSVGFVHMTSGPAWINGNAMVVVPADDLIDRNFLAYALKGGIDISESISGAAQPQITRTSLIPLLIRFPVKIKEQRRIVAILDEAFEGIATAKANAEKNLQNARELFESYLDSALTGHENGCIEAVLGDETDLLAGYAFSSKGYTDAKRGVRLLRGDNIMQGYLRWDDAKYWPNDDVKAYERFALRQGDVVLAMDRPWVKAGLKRAQIGINDFPCLQLQRTARLRPKQRMRMDFLFHLVGSRLFSQHLLSVQTGLGVPHISGKQIESFRFMLPSMKDQARIAAKLDELHQCVIRLEMLYEQKKSSLQQLKKSILEQAFAGRLEGSNR